MAVEAFTNGGINNGEEEEEKEQQKHMMSTPSSSSFPFSSHGITLPAQFWNPLGPAILRYHHHHSTARKNPRMPFTNISITFLSSVFQNVVVVVEQRVLVHLHCSPSPFIRCVQVLSYVDMDASTTCKVLLVEDTEINRVVVRRLLGELNVRLEEATNGKVAVDFIREGKAYDLILMDKEMPTMDGHEATRQMRSLGVTTPIVALSSNSLQSDRDLFIHAGADDFLPKPLSRDKLAHILSKYGLRHGG